MFSFCFLFLIHINVHSCKPREDEEEACSKRGIGGRSALAVRTFPHCSYSLYSAQCTARRRGSGGVTAVAAPAVALARSVAAAAVRQQRQTLHCRSSLPSREPQSDYSAPLRTRVLAQFKPPKIAIAAAGGAAAATPPPVLLLVLLPRVCMYVVYGAPLSSRALHIARHFLRSSLNYLNWFLAFHSRVQNTGIQDSFAKMSL